MTSWLDHSPKPENRESVRALVGLVAVAIALPLIFFLLARLTG